ncbi:hypothetical protein V5N11_008510 [Cardamine amara subsp. amara]|uniref:C2H2-type domain-containing protein n=1 Tax=Cardamine amara subsp. amara TaxID=228776 RepID=A0ABD0ZWA7_CARAN
MENQALSSSSSSTPKSEILQSLIETMKESNEKETRNTNLTLGSPPDATSERRIEIPSFRSVPVRRGSEIMKFYPPKSNKIYSCPFCKKGFSTPRALGGHQKAHKQELEDFLGPAFLNPYLNKPHIFLGGYSTYALSNEHHDGITPEPFKSLFYPSFNSGVTEGIAGMYPLIHKNIFPFLHPRTSRDLVPQENVLSEENLISKIGMKNVVETDDDEDQQEEGTFKSGGIDLSLSL